MERKNGVKPQTDKEEAAYKPSGAELAAIERCQARGAARAPLRFTDDEEAGKLKIDHPDPRIASALYMDAFGSVDKAFCDGMINQLLKITDIRYDIDGIIDLNYLVSIINGFAPRDQLEAMLAAQMAAVHLVSMQMVRQFMLSKPTMQEGPERAFNRTMRTFAALVETLNHYRSRGEQNITHVPVVARQSAPREKVPETAPPSQPHSTAQNEPFQLYCQSLSEWENASSFRGSALKSNDRLSQA